MRKHHLRHLCFAAAFLVVVAACTSPKRAARSQQAAEAAQRSFFSAFADSLEKGLDQTQYGYSIAIYSGSELVLNRSAGQRSKDVDKDGAQPFTNNTRFTLFSSRPH